MGEIVEFPSNGSTAQGYLSSPESPGPGVIVIHEWWGLVDHIKDVADRLAREGYFALVPDLFQGNTASNQEPDEAAKLMMQLQLESAAKDMSGAYDYLVGHDGVQSKKIGSIGFCMGGALSLKLATIKPIDACVVFYGVPLPDNNFDSIRGPVLGHFAEHDDTDPDKLEQGLKNAGKDVEFHTYEGTAHAFFNDTRPETYDADAAKRSWQRTLDFFGKHLR